ELALVLLIEASRGWKTMPIEVRTPLQTYVGARLASPIILVPILRAGLGLCDGMSRIVPDAAVGHIGLYRDPKTLRPVSYYSRLPENIAEAQVLVLDPMLATGHTACAATSMVKAQGAMNIQFICVLACPAGIAQLQSQHPDVPIVAAAVDPDLDQFGYIVPGLGDAGDRYFGTD
ncbi:MAG: uracil phosphoribosyltransferase, partial [Chthoniobacterales bacterium]